jgi:thiamine biosynthesis lipoprotein ApbE
MLAFGPQAWPVELTGDIDSERIVLSNQSLSASGTAIQGSHIIHPGGETAMPAEPCRRVWVTAPTATLAEIWSTSLMLLEPGDIPDFIAGEQTLSTVHLQIDDRPVLLPRGTGSE